MEENLNYNRNTENNVEPTDGKPVKKHKSAFVLSVVFTSLCVAAAVLSLLLTGVMLKETGNKDQQLGFAVLVIVLLIPDIVLTVLTEVFGAVSITACARLIKTDKQKSLRDNHACRNRCDNDCRRGCFCGSFYKGQL